jgi:hypothetical protein
MDVSEASKVDPNIAAKKFLMVDSKNQMVMFFVA